MQILTIYVLLTGLNKPMCFKTNIRSLGSNWINTGAMFLNIFTEAFLPSSSLCGVIIESFKKYQIRLENDTTLMFVFFNIMTILLVIYYCFFMLYEILYVGTLFVYYILSNLCNNKFSEIITFNIKI